MTTRILPSLVIALSVVLCGCPTKPTDPTAGDAPEKPETPVASPGKTPVKAPRVAGGLEKLLPSDTIAYLSIEDMAGTRADFKGTGMYDLYREPEVQAFLAKPIARLKAEIAQAEDESGVKLDDVFDGFGGQVVASLTDLGLGDGQPQVGLVALAQVTDKDAAGRVFDRIVSSVKEEYDGRLSETSKLSELNEKGWRGIRLKPNDPEEPVTTLALSSTLMLAAMSTNRDATVQSILAGEALAVEDSLAGSKKFESAMAKLDSPRVYSFYLAADDLRDSILEITSDEDPEDSAIAVKILDNLGIGGKLSVAGGLSFTPPGMTHKLYVNAPAPRKGLFEIVGSDDLGPRVVRSVHDEMQVFAACRLDLAAVMNIVRGIAGSVDEGDNFEQGLQQLKMMVGFDIERDLIGSLGEHVLLTSYSADPSPNPMFTPYRGLVIAIELTDSAKINGIMSGLMGMADMAVKSMGMPGISRVPVGGGQGWTTNVMGMISPCIAVTDSALVIAGDVKVAEKFLAALDGKHPEPVVETAGFKKLAERVGGFDGPGMLYARVATAAEERQGDPRIALSGLPPAVSEMIQGWVDFEKWPGTDTLLRHAVPQLDVVHADDDGLLLVGYGLVGGSGAPTVVAAGSVGLAIALPNLVAARESARRVKCMSNLKQLGVACHVYSTDNRDAFPPTLDALKGRYVQDDALYECPSAPGKPAYAYVSGLKASSRPRSVLIYELADNHDRAGRNVLFLDAHVEWLTEGRFRAALESTLANAAAQGLKVKILGDADAPEAGGGGGGGAAEDIF